MLSDVIGDRSKPQVVEVTTKLRDGLLKHMGSTGDPVFDTSDPSKMATGLKFRMSSLHTACPRMYALAVANNGELLTDGDVVDPELGWIFGTGSAIHYQFQNEYLLSLGDVFQGWWKCRRCGHVHRGKSCPEIRTLSNWWIPKPKSCSHCAIRSGATDVDDFEYVEIEVSDPRYRVTGHLDGILDWRSYDCPDDYVEALEIKTIGQYGYKSVDPESGGLPLAQHVVQCNGYMWALEDAGINRTRIVYVSKDFGRKMADSIVEHHLMRSDRYVNRIQSVIRDSISAVQSVAKWHGCPSESRGDPDIPDRLSLCTKRSDKRAKYCPAKDLCFRK